MTLIHKDAPENDEAQPDVLAPATPEQVQKFQEELFARSYRDKPYVLIVEDEAFSSAQLRNLLQRTHYALVAPNAARGWELYLEYAPDICFFDIELPYISGHGLAETIHAFDPNAYIVMVTASHMEADVLKALANKVKGFITKPYSRQKILDAVQKFEEENKIKANPEKGKL